MIANPILPGFHPDPSWVRVNGAVYLTASTFGWLPGLPIYRSPDLAAWEALPAACGPSSGIDLLGCECDDGLYAPGLRHDGKRFLLTCTVVRRKTQQFRNFIMTSEDPAQGWHEPIWLPDDLGRIDPTPFIDSNGSVYVVLNDHPSTDRHYGAGREIRLWQLDPDHLQPIAGPWVLWHGHAVAASTPEAPRLFQRGDWYYLIIAEGGTGHHHAVTVARSRSVTGPYESCPGNPRLTHRHLGPNEPIQSVGHADLIEWEGQDWWSCVLAEFTGNSRNIIGRQTALCPVNWPRDDWPTFSPGIGKLKSRVDTPGTQQHWPDSGWLALRRQPADAASFHGEVINIAAGPSDWDDSRLQPALIGRRITDDSGTWQATCSGFGGIGLYTTNGAWVRIRRQNDTVRVESARKILSEVPVKSVTVHMRIVWTPEHTMIFVNEMKLCEVGSEVWSRPIFAGAVAVLFATELGSCEGTIHPDNIIGVDFTVNAKAT